MKKLLPIILVFLFSLLGSRLIGSGAINPTTMIAMAVGFFLIMLLVRPKQAAPKPAAELEKEILGDYAADAFAEDPQLAAKFQAALKDYRGSMPKAALNKLQKLAPLCSAEKDVYAVAMASALIQTALNNHNGAIKEYVRALSLHQDGNLAMKLGSSYQRVGELDKAIDSYEFALDLNPELTEARTKLATAMVADHRFNLGLKHALTVLEKDENNDSALATAAICSALLGDSDGYQQYLEKAVANGYKKDKITQTVDALKKRK